MDVGPISIGCVVPLFLPLFLRFLKFSSIFQYGNVCCGAIPTLCVPQLFTYILNCTFLLGMFVRPVYYLEVFVRLYKFFCTSGCKQFVCIAMILRAVIVGASVAEWVACRPSDLKVHGSRPELSTLGLCVGIIL